MNTYRLMLVLILFPVILGCSASINRKAMKEELSDGPPVYDDQDIQRIEKIEPQAKFPLRIAVAPPYQRSHRNRWSPDERKVISSWQETFRDVKTVEQVFVLPNILVQGKVRSGEHDSYLKRIRVAAARHNANTVLILHTVSESDVYANPLAILDLTVVGNWIFPGHSKKSVTMMEGVLVDTRNLFLYGSGYAHGERTSVAPRVFIRGVETHRKARLRALEQFGDEFTDLMKRLQEKRTDEAAEGSSPGEK